MILKMDLIRDTDNYLDNVSVPPSFINQTCPLYITTSLGMADQMDHDYSTWFLAVSCDILASQNRSLAKGEQVDVFEDAKKIIDCTVDCLWNHFLLNFFTLRRYFPVEGGFEDLECLLQAWLAWLTVMNKGSERPIGIITFAHDYAGGDNHAMLRKVLEVILDDISPTQSREQQLTYFMGITSICRALFNPAFSEMTAIATFSNLQRGHFYFTRQPGIFGGSKSTTPVP